MAEGFLRDLAGDRFDVASAGYQPAEEVCGEEVLRSWNLRRQET